MPVAASSIIDGHDVTVVAQNPKAPALGRRVFLDGAWVGNVRRSDRRRLWSYSFPMGGRRSSGYIWGSQGDAVRALVGDVIRNGPAGHATKEVTA